MSMNSVFERKAREEKTKLMPGNSGRRAGEEIKERSWAEQIQARLLKIVDTTPSLVAMADRNGRLFYMNPAGRALLKLRDEDEVAGRSFTDCHAPGVRERLNKEAIPLSARDGLWTGNSILLARDGSEVRTALTLVAHRDGGGNLEGFSAIERDMTEWIRTEEALQTSTIQLQRLRARHLTVQEIERQRIAADLHDGLGQSLSLLKLSIQGAADLLRAGAAGEALARLDQLARNMRSVIDELRGVAMNLRPSIIDDLGIRATLAWFFREFEASGTKTRMERDIDIAESDVPPPLKIVIFRILQEAVNNAVKHACANRISVKLGMRNAGDTLEFCVEDDGSGFDPAGFSGALIANRGLGIQSMRERAELSGADFELESAEGKGTRIHVRWPSVGALNREIATLPPKTVAVIRNAPASDAVHVHALATSAQSDFQNFMFCVACRRARGSAL